MLMQIILVMIILLMVNLMLSSLVVIYNGDGVWSMGALMLQKRLSYSISSSYKISFMNTEEIKDNLSNIKLLVIPGGADIPYTKSFSPSLLRKIKRWIGKGGSFLGICAGAYFSSAEIEFEKGTEAQVIGKRLLKLFGGKAVGAISEGRINPIAIDITCLNSTRNKKENDKESSLSMKMKSYYHRGCWFENIEKDSNVKILANYSGNGKPAIIWNKYKKGRFLLTGIHPEVSPRFISNDSLLGKNLKKHFLENRILWTIVLKTLRIKTKIPILKITS